MPSSLSHEFLSFCRWVLAACLEELFQFLAFRRCQGFRLLAQQGDEIGRQAGFAIERVYLGLRVGDAEAPHVVLVQGFMNESHHEAASLWHLDQ